MLLVPSLALAHVRDVSPTRPPTQVVRAGSGDDRLFAARVQPSRSRALLLAFERANASDPTTTTTTLAPPATARRTTTVSTRRTTTTARKATTTTTRRRRPAPKPTTTTSPRDDRSQEGDASWYDPPRAGICAHRTLRFGTTVTVTNVANGKQTTCEVGDRGPFVAGRVIDLSREQFAAIAPTSRGIVRVRIEW